MKQKIAMLLLSIALVTVALQTPIIASAAVETVETDKSTISERPGKGELDLSEYFKHSSKKNTLRKYGFDHRANKKHKGGSSDFIGKGKRAW